MVVFISTVGLGSRVRELSKGLNKAFLPLNNKPVLSWILESFPKDSRFVIATGFQENLVKEYLKLAHSDLNIETVSVFPYEGEGAGLGYSLLCCKQYLQEPFIFCPCDTLISNIQIPLGNKNWICCNHLVGSGRNYRTVQSLEEPVLREKGFHGYEYTGLCGIVDYEQFWKGMEESEDTVSVGEVAGLRNLDLVTVTTKDWVDVGNPEMYERAALRFTQKEKHILPKRGEAIWFVGDRVIKYSESTKFIEDRVARYRELQGFVPELLESTEHMYSYRYSEGTVVSNCINLPIFQRLLTTSQRFWEPRQANSDFTQRCLEFYKDKTLKRIQLFYDRTGKEDVSKINGRNLPSLEELLNEIDWNWIAAGEPVRFHGDFHFENIVYGDGKFTFLDWRQRFGNSLTVGDLYYDFAKLMHGLIVSHGLISEGRFSVDWKEDEISYSLDRKQILVQCEQCFKSWLQEKGYDLKKVEILTALIYLNICGLHEEPYGLMLYALGKEMLYDTLFK